MPEPLRIPSSGAMRLPSVGFPPDDHPAWERLIKNPKLHEFKYAAAGMLMFNLNLQWKRDPGRLPSLAEQARTFVRKYRHLLARDIHEVFD